MTRAINKKAAVPLSKSDQLSLPLWPEKDRAAPAAMLRSALFRVLKRGKHTYVRRQLIASWAGTRIEYTGELLDQSDFDVFLQCLHLSRKESSGSTVQFSLTAFLKSLNKRGGDNVRLLKNSLHRMNGCVVSIETKRFQYEGNLIQETYLDKESGRYVVALNEKLANLFRSGYSRQNWEQRLALPGGFPRWLLGYVVSHPQATAKRPHRIAVAVLQELCGSQFTKLPHFREKLRKAMQQLQENGVIHDWKITSNDALEFSREGVHN